ncbi:MAG: MFS transporter [Candidatus Micrarchaeota archaeon]
MKRSTLGLIVTLLYGFSFNGLVATVLPLYLRDRGVSLAEMGVIFSAYYFVTQFLRVFIGAVADRIGHRSLIRASGFLQLATVLVYYLSPFNSLFLVGRILEGLSASIVRATDRAILYSGALTEKMDVGKAAAKYSLFLWVGIGLGSFFGGLMAGIGYEYVFGLLMILSLCFAWLARFEPKKRRESLRGVFSHAFSWQGVKLKLKRLAIIRSLDGVGWSLTTSFLLVIILKEFYGLGPEMIGAFLFVMYIARAFSGYAFGMFAEKVDERKFFIAFSLLMAVASAIAGGAIAFGLGIIAFSLAIFAIIVFSGMKSPAFNKIVVLSANKNELGKELGLALLGFGLGQGFGDLFSGALAGLGGFAVPYFLAAVAQLILAWAIWKFI